MTESISPSADVATEELTIHSLDSEPNKPLVWKQVPERTWMKVTKLHKKWQVLEETQALPSPRHQLIEFRNPCDGALASGTEQRSLCNCVPDSEKPSSPVAPEAAPSHAKRRPKLCLNQTMSQVSTRPTSLWLWEDANRKSKRYLGTLPHTDLISVTHN